MSIRTKDIKDKPLVRIFSQEGLSKILKQIYGIFNVHVKKNVALVTDKVERINEKNGVFRGERQLVKGKV